MTHKNTNTALAQELCAGIDVAKEKLDVCIGKDTLFVVANDATGWAELTSRLVSASIVRVALEATGGALHLPCARAMAAAGITVDVAHPLCVRRFAQARRAISAKTDRADARVLSAYAASALFRPREVTTNDQQALRECHARRRQLVDDRGNEQKRLKQCTSPAVIKSIKSHLDQLAALIKELESEIAQLVARDEELEQRKKLLLTAPGVGVETAHSLLANLPELGTLDRGAIASLVGLAPHRCESGGWKGEARIAGGRAVVRRSLYMAVQGALRANDNSPVKEVFERVYARNPEARKKAHIAAARKLLTILNAMAKSNEPYDASFAEKEKNGGKRGKAA